MFRHFSITMLGFGGQMILSLAAGILAARLLGPQARGELAALLLLPLTLQLLASAGFPHALTFLTAKNNKNAGVLTGTVALIVLALSLIGVLIGYLSIPYLFHDFSPLFRTNAAVLLLLLLPALSLYGVPSNTSLGLKHYTSYNGYRLFASFLYLLAVCGAYFSQSALTVVWLYALLMLAIGLPFSVWVYVFTIHQKPTYDKSQIPALRRFALPTFLSQLPQTVGQRLDQFIILTALSTTALGYYSVALGIAQMFLTLQQSVGTILLPYLAQETEDNQRQHTFALLLRLTIAATVFGAAILCLLLPVLLPLMFGSAFTPAVPVAQILLIAFAVYGLHAAFMDGFRGWNLPKLPLYGEIIYMISKTLFMLAAVLMFNTNVIGIAWLCLAAAIVPLLYDLYQYHTRIQNLDAKWWAAYKSDVTLITTKIREILLK